MRMPAGQTSARILTRLPPKFRGWKSGFWGGSIQLRRLKKNQLAIACTWGSELTSTRPIGRLSCSWRDVISILLGIMLKYGLTTASSMHITTIHNLLNAFMLGARRALSAWRSGGCIPNCLAVLRSVIRVAGLVKVDISTAPAWSRCTLWKLITGLHPQSAAAIARVRKCLSALGR